VVDLEEGVRRDLDLVGLGAMVMVVVVLVVVGVVLRIINSGAFLLIEGGRACEKLGGKCWFGRVRLFGEEE
jgi:hypothetical protein